MNEIKPPQSKISQKTLDIIAQIKRKKKQESLIQEEKNKVAELREKLEAQIKNKNFKNSISNTFAPIPKFPYQFKKIKECMKELD